MTQYAKYISETEIQLPAPEEFRGIPNWRQHDALLRQHGYLPLVGEPEQRDGYTAKPSEWHIVEQSETRIEPRPYEVEDYEEYPDEEHPGQVIRVKTGTHTEWRDTEIAKDTSYIQVDEWAYIPIPAPEPPPLPTRFSKGTLLEALMACGLYEQAREIYAADMDLQIAWAGFADIDMDYPACRQIMRQYPDLFTEANVLLLREWIRDNQ